MRKIGSRSGAASLLAMLVCVGCAALSAQAEPEPTPVGELRDNLWLCESLMGEIVDVTLVGIEPAPRAVRLEKIGKFAGTDLMRQVVFERMQEAGYEVYTDVEDSARQAAVDYVYRFEVRDLDLSYPEVGRTLGVWRRWVDREVKITADVTLTEAASGRVLFDDLVQRRFVDRIAAGHLDDVRSTTFAFTDPSLGESGWQRRMEEIVVLGTLAGMVTVYFANTGD